MRIACLQFAPQVGDIDNNLNRADAVLSKANPQNLDLLVLPELAFSGYNFKSLQHISPYLEPTTAGITSLWARTTALKYECVVTAGYPEKVDITPKWPASPEYYNSAITVNKEGETIANYRKSFLYYTDETWALEGPDGFYDGEIEGLGNTAMGICKWPTKSFERMDLNPYKFESPWSAWEFAYHILHRQANLVILSMAWLTRENARSYSRAPKEPDMDTLSYWLARLEPVIRAESEGEIIVVLANRCGVEGEAVYAGTSAVLGIQGGEVKVYGILGRGERELLVVDTTKPPQAKLISERSESKRESISSNRDSVGSNPPRTNSTISERSAKSNLSISTTTTNGSMMGPRTPEAMNLSMDVSMDDIMTPLSPVDAKSPNVYFPPKEGRKEDDIQREILRSSIPILDEIHCEKLRLATPVKDEMELNQQAPTTPPKDETQAGDLWPNPLLKDEPIRKEADSALSLMDVDDSYTDDDEVIDVHCEVLKSSIQTKFDLARSDSPVFVRPPSPKSRNASRTREPVYLEPALISHDLAQEPQIIRPPSARSGKSARSPPHSASAVSEAHHPNWSVFGPRSDHILRRPRSMVW